MIKVCRDDEKEKKRKKFPTGWTKKKERIRGEKRRMRGGPWRYVPV